ncbi:MAG TPA: protein-export chaperone SecB [Methylophilaceae bacterium]|nr:protein-export chaperone SecB [Methylophilaceae bacterium]HQR59940.1 protein-export chaperone SecB [Methylophilaceae bacterium]
MAEEQQQPAAQEQDQQPVFGIEKIYVKDLSLEIPNAPQVFLQRETPQVGIELQNSANPVGEGLYEAVLTITVTSKLEDKTVFLVEVAQAGIFQVRNVPEESLEGIFGVTCPNILFPYARETISDVVTRAGFPPVLLNPINFEALFVQQKQQAQQAGASETTH